MFINLATETQRHRGKIKIQPQGRRDTENLMVKVFGESLRELFSTDLGSAASCIKTQWKRRKKVLSMKLFSLCLCASVAILICSSAFAAEQYPQRIISLNPSVTEILFSLKLDDRIIAVTNNCDYPPAAKSKTKIGDMSLNYEKIVSLRPDLIIAEGSIFKESLNKLKNMKMPLFIVSCNNIEQFKNSFLLIGQKTGKYELALKLVKDFESKLNKIKSRSGRIYASTTMTDQHKSKPKVFVEVWNQPIMTAGKGTFFNDIIKIAGGINIAEKLNKSYPVVNTEFLIKNNPDIIILTTSKPEEVYGNIALKNISAVKNKKVYKINPDIISRPTLRLADAAEQIEKWIKIKSK